MSGNCGKEHIKIVNEMSSIFDAKKIIVRANQSNKGGYFPDLSTIDTDFEVEICPKVRTLDMKALKWDRSRKKVLIIGFFDRIYDHFDEVYFFKNELIKLK